jgi:hypothetical protein
VRLNEKFQADALNVVRRQSRENNSAMKAPNSDARRTRGGKSFA